MKQYINLYETLTVARTAIKNISQTISDQTRNLAEQYRSLLPAGWKGDSADTFKQIWGAVKAEHTADVTAFGDCTEALLSLSRNGVTAIQDAQNTVMLAFDGGGFANSGGVELGYEDTVPVEDDGNRVVTLLDDLCSTLSVLQAKQGELSQYCTVDGAGSIMTLEQEMREDYVDFMRCANTARKIYAEFVEGLTSSLSGCAKALAPRGERLEKGVSDPTLDTLSGIKRIAFGKCGDPSSPVYRAMAFTRLLMQIPEEYRAEFERLCYAADPRFQKIFFAYVDTVEIKAWTGTSGPSWSIPGNKGPLVSIFEFGGLYVKECSGETSYETVDGNTRVTQVASNLFFTLFHEIGHRMDYNTMASPTRDNLDDLIRSDIRNTLLDRANTAIANGSYVFEGRAATDMAYRQTIINNAVGRLLNSNVYCNDETFRLRDFLQQQIVGELCSQNEPIGNGVTTREDWMRKTVSDVYGGATQNALKGQYGHDDFYWLPGTQMLSAMGSVAGVSPVITPQIELIADSFSAGMMNNDSWKESIREYMPQASAQVEKVFDDMAAQADKRMKNNTTEK